MRWTFGGCDNQGFEQLSCCGVRPPKALGMPLNSQSERMVRDFKSFDDAVGGNRTDRGAGCGLIHRLVVLAVDPKASPLKDALQEGVGLDSDFV